MSNFRKVPLSGGEDEPTEVYARVYDDHIDIVGRNVTLEVKRGGYGRGTTQRWAYGENWHVRPLPWEASKADDDAADFTPGEGE